MANASSILDRLRGVALDHAADYAADSGVRLVIGSNVSPELVAYDAAASGSVLDLLGIVPYARLEDSSGRVLASYGDTVPIEWAKVIIYGALLAVIGAAIIKGFVK